MTSDASTSTPTPAPATPSDLGSAMLERHKPRRLGAMVVAMVAGGAGLVAGTQLGESPAGAPAAAPSHDMQSMPGMSHGAGSQAVYISPARQQLVGVRSAPVTRQT